MSISVASRMSSLRNVLPCTFLNYEFAVQTRFCIEPLTSCQSNEFAYRKLASSGCHGYQVQNRHGWRWFYSIASFSLEKLVVEQCTRMHTQQRHGRRWFQAPMSLRTANSCPDFDMEVKIWTALGIGGARRRRVPERSGGMERQRNPGKPDRPLAAGTPK